MNRRWRKIAAVIMALFLSYVAIAAEFSHRHSGSETAVLSLTEGRGAGIRIHSFTCQACFYSLTNLAPSLSFQSLKPVQETLCFKLWHSIFYFFVLPNFNHLRAPPADHA
jgi:hypothetical protein